MLPVPQSLGAVHSHCQSDRPHTEIPTTQLALLISGGKIAHRIYVVITVIEMSELYIISIRGHE